MESPFLLSTEPSQHGSWHRKFRTPTQETPEIDGFGFRYFLPKRLGPVDPKNNSALDNIWQTCPKKSLMGIVE
jgi:hypothetical protein